MKNKRLLLILALIAVLLLTPLIAMQFTTEVNWDSADFIIMAVLLLTTGLVCELILRKFKTFKSRILICGVVLFLFFLIWAELAVGIFGSPFAGS
jgi:Kef-type K+ transport system membrane component KefB